MQQDDYLDKTTTFEKSRLKHEKQRGDTFKLVSIGLFILLILLLIALIILSYMKTVYPYVIQVDKATGNQMVLTSLDYESYTPSEIEDKFNINRYIIAREGYVYDTLQSSYDLVLLMTDEKIVKSYTDKYLGDESRDKILGDKVIIEPRIISISLQENNGANTAIVRVELIKKNLVEKIEESKTVLVTMSYKYNMDNIVSEEERLKNPLGFMVEYYRIDNENI